MYVVNTKQIHEIEKKILGNTDVHPKNISTKIMGLE